MSNMHKWFRGPFTEPESEDDAYGRWRQEMDDKVSETPRTDAAELAEEGEDCVDYAVQHLANLARQLERELSVVQAKLAALTAPGEYNDLVKRLHDDRRYPLFDPSRHDRQEAATAIEQLQARVREAEHEVLPCDVMLPPATIIRRGCSLKTLLIGMRAEHRNGLQFQQTKQLRGEANMSTMSDDWREQDRQRIAELEAKLATLTAPGEYDELLPWLRDPVYQDWPHVSKDAATAIEQLQAQNTLLREGRESDLKAAKHLAERVREAEASAMRHAVRAEQAEARPVEYKEDAERLDWIIENSTSTGGGTGFTLFLFVPVDMEHAALREAIDAARREKT